MDVTEIKTLVEDQGKAIESLKTSLVDRVAKAEKAGEGVAEVKAETAKVAAAVDALSKTTKAVSEKVEKLDTALARQVKSVSVKAVPRYGKLNAFTGEGAEEKAIRAGHWLRWAMTGHAGSKAWCLEHGVMEEKALSEAVPADGGFLVPDEMSNAIIDLRHRYGVARQELSPIAMASDTISFPVATGGVTGYFVGEGVASTQSSPTWGNVRLVAKKLMTDTRYSTELADDAIINIGDRITDEIARAFAEKEDDCLFNGTGTSTYGGMVGVRTKIIDGNYTAGAKDAASGHDTFAEIDAADLATVMAALPPQFLGTAKWYCSQPAFALVFQRLVAAGGGNTIDSLAGPARYQYLGFPIVISQKMPTATSDISDTAMLLFGDLSKAVLMGSRREIRVLRSEHYAANVDQIAIFATERFDINVHGLGDTSTAGAVVALIGE